MPRSATRLAVVCALFVGCASIASAQVGAARDQASPAPPPTGTGRITGQVVAADTGTPVKRAQVALMGSASVRTTNAETLPDGTVRTTTLTATGGGQTGGMPAGMVRKQAETDESGRFDFTNLPAGQFSVMAMASGGFVGPQRAESVRLTDGQTANLTLRLPRGGAITGRILDESGDPLVRVEVRALRRDATAGGRLNPTGMGGYGSTDDLGQFRLWGLPAGEYYVAARYSGTQGMVIMEPTADTPPRTGFGPTYYPGSASVEGARRVTVRAGQDTGGIEFSMLRVPLARIVGTATDSTGRPLAAMGPSGGGSVMISSKDEPGSGRGGSIRPDGTFVVTDVTPGDYYLWASFRAAGTGPDAEQEAGWVAVTVNGSDVTANLQTNHGATVSGRVIVEGGQSAQTGAMPGNQARMQIGARSEPGMPYLGGFPRPVQVAEDGTFEMKGLRGSIVVTPVAMGRGVLKSVSRGTQDVTGKPMLLQGTEQITDLVIVMTTDTGTLNGMVTDASGEPAPNAMVLVFPDDPERWFSGSPFVVTARTVTTTPQLSVQRMTAAPGQPTTTRWTPVVGGFTTGPRLLPGRYLVAVFPDSNPMPPTDRESLEKLRASATAVTVGTSEPANVQLRLPK